MSMFFAQCKAEFIRLLRRKKTWFTSLLLPTILYFVYDQSHGTGKFNGADISTYLLMAIACFGLVMTSVNTLSVQFADERKQGWTRLLKMTPLPNSYYLSAKIVSQFIINLSSLVFLFLIGAFTQGVELSLWQWISCTVWILLATIPFMTLGILIGTIRIVEIVQIISSLTMMLLSLLGGLLMPIQTLPHWLQKYAIWSPTYRLGQGAWDLIAGHSPHLQAVWILAGYAIIFIGLATFIIKRQEAI
ncbi:ABC-2 type transport system permease protein [Seinonella peptonophila]|uniref:Transport permease protein n=1 Tax=Seinonella peptonophila TaxID=112248 RepID=A0A1M4Z636_9BACL|nr:ABC transporter permease [Seinonella peptonophila]SHF13460.1 ABC-2 type transport system permease protein [Seinonella peptonophila]